MHEVILLGKYGIWGGIHGGKPRRAGTPWSKHIANLLSGIAWNSPVETGPHPGRGLPIQTGWRLGGEGAWHIGADPARRLGP